MLEELLGSVSPELRTTLKIGEGRLKEIKPAEMRAWIQKILLPVKDSVREVLDDPENKDLWVTEVTCPTPQECAAINPASLGEHAGLKYIGIAMSLSAGNGLILHSVERGTHFARKLYTADRNMLLHIKESYLGQKSEADRSNEWLHDFILVGAASLDGTKLTIHPLEQAVAKALQWLSENGERHKGSLGLQGGTI